MVRTHITTLDSEYFKSGEQHRRPCGYAGNFFRWYCSVGEWPHHLRVKCCRSKDGRIFSRTVTGNATKIQAVASDCMRCLAENKMTKRCLKHPIVAPKYIVFSYFGLKVHWRLFLYDIITVFIESSMLLPTYTCAKKGQHNFKYQRTHDNSKWNKI